MSEISIIVPVYKAEQYLRRCVDSILAQTFSDFDLILVDDGSPDQCPLICDEYAVSDHRIHVIHQVNSGPSLARNNGIEWVFAQSNSRYLAFVDSDDYLHPQFLEYMYQAVESAQADVGMCCHKYVTDSACLNGVKRYNISSVKEISAENLMVAQWSGFNYVWGKLFAKKSFQTLRYPKDVSFGEDNLVIFRVMFEASRIVFVDNELYYYFYNPTGITKSPWTPKSLDVFEGIRVQLTYYAEHNYAKAYEKEIELYIQQYAYQIHRIREDKVNFAKNRSYMWEMQKQMKKLLRQNNSYKARKRFYWYEAVYPKRARVLNIAGKVKRNLKRNGMSGTAKKLLKKCFAVLFIYICVSLWLSYNYLSTTYVQVSDEKITAPLRIVLVSDLHDHVFGKDNSKLIQKIAGQAPNLIILDGDMINSDSGDSHVATDLISALTEIAPVYYSLGNHEIAYMENGNPELLQELKMAGAVVLNNNIVDIEVNGNKMQLGGIYEYAFDTPMQDAQSNENAIAYMERFTSEVSNGEYTLICAHRPESLYCFNYADELWNLDMVLSGHLHGGQVIIPFIGGLYSSMEAFFPTYDYGKYEIGDCIMIITRGLSSNKKVLPRFNNPPEIIVVDMN